MVASWLAISMQSAAYLKRQQPAHSRTCPTVTSTLPASAALRTASALRAASVTSNGSGAERLTT